jgi:hypothetical protein
VVTSSQSPPNTLTPPPVAGPRPWKCSRAVYAKIGELGLFREHRYQLIRGEIIDMGQQGPRYYTAVQLVAEMLKTAFGVGYCVRNSGPLGFADSEPEPDVAVVAGSPRDYLTDHPATALLAVEVADSSLSYDTTTKAELYASAGIPEYWVLDLNSEQLIVFRSLARIAGLDTVAYSSQTTYHATDTVTPLHGRASVSVRDLLP